MIQMENERRRILVLEYQHSGHTLVYVREIVMAGCEAGHDVVISLTPKAIESDEFRAHLSDLRFEVLPLMDRFSPTALRKLVRENQIDAVIIPNSDDLLTSFFLAPRSPAVPVTLLVMRDPAWEIPQASGLRAIKLRLKGKIVSGLSRRKGMNVVHLRSYGYSGKESFVVDPFIADDSLEGIRDAALVLRENLCMTADVFWYLVTGAITDRKNVPLIAEALTRVRRENPGTRVGLALVGPQRATSDLSKRGLFGVDVEGIEYLAEDRVISNLEMNQAISAANAVVMAYSSHSPNSTMLKAYALGTKLVVAGPESVQGFASAMGFELVGELHIDALVRAMTAAMATPASAPAFDEVPTGRDFANYLVAIAVLDDA